MQVNGPLFWAKRCHILLQVLIVSVPSTSHAFVPWPLLHSPYSFSAVSQFLLATMTEFSNIQPSEVVFKPPSPKRWWWSSKTTAMERSSGSTLTEHRPSIQTRWRKSNNLNTRHASCMSSLTYIDQFDVGSSGEAGRFRSTLNYVLYTERSNSF